MIIILFKPPPQINVVSSDAFNTTLDVEITGYMHEIISVDGYSYDDYSVLGYGTTAEEGKPALPRLSVLLGIPATSDIELGNLQEASMWCENKINNPESEFDSLLAVIDLEYINLCLENESDSTKTNNLQLIHKRREKYVSFIDNKIDQLININNISMIDENQFDIVPITTRLFNNYPNPFNPETTISFDLPQRDKVELVVYNLKGQKVKSLINEEIDKGTHKVIWNGTNNQGKEVASGVYYYRLSSGNYTKTNKMVLMK